MINQKSFSKSSNQSNKKFIAIQNQINRRFWTDKFLPFQEKIIVIFVSTKKINNKFLNNYIGLRNVMVQVQTQIANNCSI